MSFNVIPLIITRLNQSVQFDSAIISRCLVIRLNLSGLAISIGIIYVMSHEDAHTTAFNLNSQQTFPTVSFEFIFPNKVIIKIGKR